MTIKGGPSHGPQVPQRWSHGTVAARVLLLACVLAFGAFLRATTPQQVEDLRPWPDALEYEESARSLYEGRGYRLWIDGAAYPPRYPPGFPIAIAMSLPLVGESPGAGIWVVQASALAAIAAAYALGRGAAGFWAGIIAALLVALSPLHVQWSRAVMSDVPASAVVAWLAVWVLAVLRRRAGVPECVLLGVAVALGGSIRSSAWLLGPAAAVVLLAFGGDGAERRRRSAALLAGLVLGQLPLLWWNAEVFGHPLADGYGYWVRDPIFSLDRAFAPGPGGGASNAWYYGALLLGGGALYPAGALPLLVLGALVAWRAPAARPLAVLAVLSVALFYGLHLAFVWKWDRFLLPVLPLLAAVMAVPFGREAPPAFRLASAFLLLAVLFQVRARPGAYDLPNPRSYDVATLTEIAAATEPNAAILARTNPFAFERILRRNADRVWVPLRLDPHSRVIAKEQLAPLAREAGAGSWIREALSEPLRPEQAVRVVRELCREGRPVYLSEQLELQIPFLPGLRLLLLRRFGLATVVPPGPYAVYRVHCAAAHSREPDPAVSGGGATSQGRGLAFQK